MSLLDEVAAKKKAVESFDIEAAYDAYVGLLWRLENPQAGDADKLADLLDKLALTVADAKADRVTLDNWQGEATDAEDCEAAWLAFGQAKADVDAAGGRVADGPTVHLARTLDAAEARYRKAKAAKASLYGGSYLHNNRYLWATTEDGSIARPRRPRVMPS